LKDSQETGIWKLFRHENGPYARSGIFARRKIIPLGERGRKELQKNKERNVESKDKIKILFLHVKFCTSEVQINLNRENCFKELQLDGLIYNLNDYYLCIISFDVFSIKCSI